MRKILMAALAAATTSACDDPVRPEAEVAGEYVAVPAADADRGSAYIALRPDGRWTSVAAVAARDGEIRVDRGRYAILGLEEGAYVLAMDEGSSFPVVVPLASVRRDTLTWGDVRYVRVR